eukprot:scaffold7162_cov96-Isochrysis_galbana.AAC.1
MSLREGARNRSLQEGATNRSSRDGARNRSPRHATFLLGPPTKESSYCGRVGGGEGRAPPEIGSSPQPALSLWAT